VCREWHAASFSYRKDYMKEEKEDIHATSVKGVGEINPPRKQGETEEGEPIAAPKKPEPVAAKSAIPPKKEH
jgi:hypothetical protein